MKIKVYGTTKPHAVTVTVDRRSGMVYEAY